MSNVKQTLLDNADAFEKAAAALEAEAKKTPRYANALLMSAKHNRQHAANLRAQANAR